MATNTSNYNLIKPTVGADDDQWGGMWNTNADTLDAQLKTNADAANGAQSAAETAQGTADTAQGAAETAQGAAETAQGAADTAQGTAETAQGTAETAQGAAETAQGTAETAQGAAETADDKATPKTLSGATANASDAGGHSHDITVASQAQAQIGTDDSALMTPQRTKQHIDNRKSDAVDSSDSDKLATSAAVKAVNDKVAPGFGFLWGLVMAYYDSETELAPGDTTDGTNLVYGPTPTSAAHDTLQTALSWSGSATSLQKHTGTWRYLGGHKIAATGEGTSDNRPAGLFLRIS